MRDYGIQFISALAQNTVTRIHSEIKWTKEEVAEKVLSFLELLLLKQPLLLSKQCNISHQIFQSLWYKQEGGIDQVCYDLLSVFLTYPISIYSFHKNYSFLTLEIQRSQNIRPKVTVNECEETIQGRKLYEEIRY